MLDNNEHRASGSFLVRKIPVVNSTSLLDTQFLDKEQIDKIKILEFSNTIDKWEKEILFAENGFFSFKGKEVENRLTEFEKELERFINYKIDSLSFFYPQYKEAALKIKQDKILSINKKMKIYEQEQLAEWENEVYEEAIKLSINRAVLYKSDMHTINSSLQNGLSVISFIAQKEEWSDKTINAKIAEYKSEFYLALINSFLEEKDICAYKFFLKYKNFLKDEDRSKIEENINSLRVNIAAYNWAKELFSYNLSEEEQEKKIKSINDSEIEKKVREFLLSFLKTEKENQKLQKQQKNSENWQKIIDILQQDVNIAPLYIDLYGDFESINSKKQYIKEITKNKHIKTDKKKFNEIIVAFFDDYNAFIDKDIENSRCFISKEDFEFLQNLKQIKNPDYEKINQDYIYAFSQIDENLLKKEENAYQFFKLFFYAEQIFQVKNKETIGLEERNKLIEALVKRFRKEKVDKNDCIIDKTCK